MPTRLAAALFGAWTAALGVVFWLVPAWQNPVRLGAGVAVLLAVGLGVRRHRPTRPAPWRLLAGALALSVTGTALYSVPLTHRVGQWTMLAAYPLLALALLLFVRYRAGGARDRGGVLDALTVISGVTLLAWAYAFAPHLRQVDLTTAEKWTVLAFPLGDLLCLALLIRLLTTSGRRLTATLLLGAGILAMTVGDVGYNLVLVRGDLEPLATFGRIPLYAAAGLAALHPSMAELTRPAAVSSTELSRLRLLLLAVASLVGPIVLIIEIRRVGEVRDLTVIGVLSILTFLLVLSRMAGIMSSYRLAVARERGLREAAAALVSASDSDEVGDAVRRAVAQLLPADVPHRVVLAISVTQD